MEILWVYYGYMMIYGNNQWILVIIDFTYLRSFSCPNTPIFFCPPRAMSRDSRTVSCASPLKFASMAVLDLLD